MKRRLVLSVRFRTVERIPTWTPKIICLCSNTHSCSCSNSCREGRRGDVDVGASKEGEEQVRVGLPNLAGGVRLFFLEAAVVWRSCWRNRATVKV